MPDFSSRAMPEPSSNSDNDSITTIQTVESVFVVLQHSKASGNSALLALSNIVGIFQNRQDAQDHLHRLKMKHKPLVTSKAHEQPTRPLFWNTSSGDDGEAEFGYQYISEYGEEYIVWIEEHQMQKQSNGDEENPR